MAKLGEVEQQVSQLARRVEAGVTVAGAAARPAAGAGQAAAQRIRRASYGA